MLIERIEALKHEMKGKNSYEIFFESCWETSLIFPPFRLTCSLYGQRRNSQSKHRKTTRDVRDAIKQLYSRWMLQLLAIKCQILSRTEIWKKNSLSFHVHWYTDIDERIRTIYPTLTTHFWVPKAIVKKMPPQFLESIQSKQRVSRKATAAAVFSTFEVDKSGQPRWTAGFLPAKSSSFRLLLLATFCAVSRVEFRVDLENLVISDFCWTCTKFDVWLFCEKNWINNSGE